MNRILITLGSIFFLLDMFTLLLMWMGAPLSIDALREDLTVVLFMILIGYFGQYVEKKNKEE